MKRRYRRTVAAAAGLAMLLAFAPAMASAEPVKERARPEFTLELSSSPDYPAITNVFDARGHGQYFNFDWGDFNLQLEQNGPEFNDGNNYLSMSKDLGSVGKFDLTGTIRLEQNEDSTGAEELALFAGRDFGDKGGLSLLGVVDTNSEFWLTRADYEGIPVAKTFKLDAGVQHNYYGDGETGQDYALGLRTDRWGFTAGLNADDSGELVFMADRDGFGAYGWTWQERFGSFDGDHSGLLRFGFSDSGTNMDGYSADGTYGVVSAFQSVPPYIGNESSMHEDGSDYRFELAWADNADARFAQFLAGKTLVDTDRFDLHGAIGPHYDDLESRFKAAWEVHMAKDGLLGSDNLGAYATVRGLDLDDTSAVVGLRLTR